MPRWNQDDATDAAAEAYRRRFAGRLPLGPRSSSGPRLSQSADVAPLLPLTEVDEPECVSEERAVHIRARWRSSWGVAVLVACLAFAAIAVGWWTSGSAAPQAVPLASPGLPGAAESPVATAHGTETAGSLLVHVTGAVQKPGVVRLPQGSRVYQAIDAAGGAAPAADLNQLNLAEAVNDGVRIYVPAVGEDPQSTESAASPGATLPGEGQAAASSKGGVKININTASVEELGTLPRVGPVMAQRIADWRKEHGPFASVEELDAVDGIGPKLMETLKDLVAVTGG
ncbi:helix-hairpin-helix domain-containing protein [Paenarthrobacter ilicis]|uniref:ComEA family DNA-binding protein n=1 Tax=Paenarthrobacter ilicis TaxID=43665 RepID=UPI0030095D4E